MTGDRDNPLLEGLLDPLLDESLGGRTPPDLTARILQAHAARRPVDLSALPASLPGPPPVPAGFSATPDAMPSNGQPVVELAAIRPARRAGSRTDWQPLLAVAGVLALAVSVAAIGYYASREPQLAEQPAQTGTSPAIAHTAPAQKPTVPEKPPATRGPSIAVVPPAPSGSTISGNRIDTPPQVAVTSPPPERSLEPPPAYRDPSPDPEVISFVNATLTSAWVANEVQPADPASDDQWCRRVFVRVLGRIPDVETELRPFLADRSKDKRARLVERLLTDERYTEEYARHWASVWANVLIGRTGGRGDSLASREGLEQYLRRALAENKPYDDLVHELLTATGTAQPGADDYNGAVNFLLAGMNAGQNGDAALATARVSRVFLGHQLQCAQCHNHPTQDWSQQQFWALNSFFRQLRVERAGDAAKLVNADFGGQRRGSTDGEVYYETPAGLLKSAFPVFLDGTAIPPTGELAQVDRRAELARFVVRSEQLPRALVNRMWAHFFGYGFTQPVDDMSPAGNAAHPELLDRLAEEFAARDYDLKSVIRWIALSDPFGRSSKLPSLRSKDMPEAGEVALFSRYYTRPLPAEEVYNSLVQAAQIRKSAASQADVEKARVDWLGQFSRPMGTDEGDEETHTGGISQSLIMMNGDLVRRAASTQHAGLLKSVTQSKLSFDEKVSHLFLAALSREPTRPEREMARKILAGSSGSQAIALEDTWWALLNSNEFVLDH